MIRSLDRNVLILLIGVLLVVGGVVLARKYKFKPDSKGFERPSPFTGKTVKITPEYIFAEPDEETKKQMLEMPPKVNPDFKMPEFPKVPKDLNRVVSSLKPVKMTKAEVEDILGKENIHQLESRENMYRYARYSMSLLEGEKTTGNGSFKFEFTEEGILERIYYIYDHHFFYKDMLDVLGKPEFIYPKSPSNSHNGEYIYASKGLTFLFNTKESSLYSMIMYEPRTLDEYKKTYRDLDQFYIEK